METPEPVAFHPPKDQWGDGPWQSEPDRVDFVSHGLACMAIRNNHGAWCGYVGVPNTHPAYGKNYDDVDVHVHGGLTYANKCAGHICHIPKPGMPADVWWLGFDCNHAFDLAPGMQELLRSIGCPRSPILSREVYRDLKYVKREIRSLAKQLAALQAAPDDTAQRTSQPANDR